MRQLPTLQVEAQGQLFAVAVRYPNMQTKPPAVSRGVIREFTRASRMRLIKQTARLSAKRAVFLTLTYPERFPDAPAAKQHLRAFMERIRRRYPKTSAIWRLELQQRGAPHFHLILFDLPYIPFKLVRSWWSDIIAEYIDDYQPRIRIELVRSRNGVMHYVSKYCAKPDDEARSGVSLSFTHICTLFWLAAAVQLAHSDAQVCALAYLYRQLEETLPLTGRYWGVHQRSKLPLASRAYIAIEVFELEPLSRVKDGMRAFWSNLNDRPERGGVIFHQQAYELWSWATQVIAPHGTFSDIQQGFWLRHEDIKHGLRTNQVCTRKKHRRIAAAKIRHISGLRRGIQI